MTDKDMNTTTERALRSFEAGKSFKFDNGSVRMCDAYQVDKGLYIDTEVKLIKVIRINNRLTNESNLLSQFLI